MIRKIVRAEAEALFKEITEKEKMLQSLERQLLQRVSEAEDDYKSKLIMIAKAKVDAENEVVQKREQLQRLVDDFEGESKKIALAYSDFLFYYDNTVADYYETKSHPAVTSAEKIREYAKELRTLRKANKEYEYLLAQMWPETSEDELIEDFEVLEEDDDAAACFLSREEYESLSVTDRNQLALDKYLARNHSKAWIGKMYERQIGYRYESQGYKVEYRGIELGLEDGGIDLICRKGNKVLLVQCKCWKQESTIYEKFICQLYGASEFYARDFDEEDFAQGGLFAANAVKTTVYPVFVTTTSLDDHAIKVAKSLGVEVLHIPLDKSYPMIKCNVNGRNKIYHLPFDQMYDKVAIRNSNEYYVRTVREAEDLGFRRAFRHVF